MLRAPVWVDYLRVKSGIYLLVGLELLIENLPEEGDRDELVGAVQVRADVADEALEQLDVVLGAGGALGVEAGFEILLQEERERGDAAFG